jgi:hypothetical protein
MSNEAQKARAVRLQALIDKRVKGISDPPSSPREFTDRAANEARREARNSNPPTITDAPVQMLIPPDISDDSWLNRPEYAWFKKGYDYACTQNQAIPAICQVRPESLFHAVAAILRGAGFTMPEVKKAADE